MCACPRNILKTHDVENWRSNSTTEMIIAFPLSTGPENPQGCSWLSGQLTYACCHRVFSKLAVCFFQLKGERVEMHRRDHKSLCSVHGKGSVPFTTACSFSSPFISSQLDLESMKLAGFYLIFLIY